MGRTSLSVVVSISQLVLVLVFGLAAIAKLVDQSGTRRAMRAFGTPQPLVRVGALALPVVELTIAAGLVVPETARAASLAALGLLALFSVVIVRALAVGAAPDCNCFGGLSQTEVGRGTLVRNLLLAGLAGVAAFGAGGEQVGGLYWVDHSAPRDRAALIALIGLVAMLGWFCWQLLRQNGRLLLRLEAQASEHSVAPTLEPGSAAPDFAGVDLSGEPVSLGSLLERGLPVALFFTDPDCGACGPALEAAAGMQRERAAELTLAVISRGDVDRMRERSDELGLERVVPQDGYALFENYGVHGVPGATVIGADGRIDRAPALGADAASEMFQSAGAAPELVHAGGAVR